MKSALILFLLVIVMGLGLAVVLRRRSSETSPLPDSDTLRAEIARLERYQYVVLPESEDGKQRRRVMRRHLCSLRSDFLRFWRVGRLLAPYAQNPDFGSVLLTQLAVFHLLWVPAWIATYGWHFECAVSNFTRLVHSVKLVRRCAQDGVEAAERAAYEDPAVSPSRG